MITCLAKKLLKRERSKMTAINIEDSNVVKALRGAISVCFTTEFSKHCLL